LVQPRLPAGEVRGVLAFSQLKHAAVDAPDMPLIDQITVGAGAGRPWASWQGGWRV